MKKAVLVGVSVLALMVVVHSVHAEVKALWLFNEGQGTTAMDSSGRR